MQPRDPLVDLAHIYIGAGPRVRALCSGGGGDECFVGARGAA